MKSIFKVFTIFTPIQLRYCIFIVFCMLVGAVFEAIGIGAILPLISIMGEPNFLVQHRIIADYGSRLGIVTHQMFVMTSASGLIIVYIIKNLYLAWQSKLQIDFAMKNQIYYAGELLAEYLNKPYLYHLEHNSMTLLRNVDNGANTVFTRVLVSILSLLTEVMTVLMIWGMLFFIDAFTATIVAGVLGFMMYSIIRMFRAKIDKQGIIQNTYNAVYKKCLNQSIGAIKETKVLGKELFFFEEFCKAYKAYGDANRKFNFINQLPRMYIETIVVSGLLLLIITKIIMGNTPMQIVPLLGVLALAAFRLMPSANRIVNLSNEIKFQIPLFNEIYDELIEIKKRAIGGNKILVSKDDEKMVFKKSLEMVNICFGYPEGRYDVLKKITFTIPKGAFVGIIGQSGTGKTTFVDILLGLLPPKDGMILADGVNIYSNIRAWQANLAYVPQNIYLIDGTIRENITLGIAEKDIDDMKVQQVLHMAELYAFIEQLPNGIYTMVGEGGVKLSGGQRQRIGVARALYSEPNVLILDEATSALDAETEKSITDTILKLKGKITIVAIAHRMSTLRACDFKVKFEAGRVEWQKGEV